MEVSLHQEEKAQHVPKEKGGFRTIPFIIGNEIFERVASVGLHVNMILYLIREYHMDSARGASVLFMWSALSNFVPVFGAFLADSYLGRFRVLVIGSVTSLIGMTLLWLTAVVPGANPPECNFYLKNCKSPTSSQLTFLFSAFVMLSIGAGGIRPCSLAFGADQLEQQNNNPNKERNRQTFFNWYYAFLCLSIMISVTVIVYIQDAKGWGVGFGIPVVLMAFSVILFLMGSPLYIKVKADRSMFSGFLQVVVVAIRNRRLAFPAIATDGLYHHNKGFKLVIPTEKLRFFNKACIVRNPTEDLKPDGTNSNPWRLCRVDQVEDFKSVIRVLPLWSTGIVIAAQISQHSFPVLQASTMDRHLGPKFRIPPGSFGVFGILTVAIWVIIYDRLVVPQLAKITGRPRGLSMKQRMGIGLLLGCVATAVAAVVEQNRRHRAILAGLENNGRALVDMSAFWLVPQHFLVGLAEGFNAIGQIDFYYSEFPQSMASIGVSLLALGMAFGNLFGSAIVEAVDRASRSWGKESWVSTNLNRGHYDYYYWVLTALGVINLLYFLLCSWAYGEEGENNRYWEEEEKEEKGDMKGEE